MSAQAFAARIVDWRDEDEDVTNDGAEAGTYAESGLSYAPSNRPFHSVEELRFLLELSTADYGKLRP
jgi:general secretion pathway protein K